MSEKPKNSDKAKKAVRNVRRSVKDFATSLFERFSHDIGIDLGTTNTLVYVRGRGIVIQEPSIVSVNRKTGQLVAVGKNAETMLGRTPGHIEVVKPIVAGVISDFEITEEMLRYLLRRAGEASRKLIGPRVVVAVPSGITNVEMRAVRDAVESAGAREVHIIEGGMAGAIGVRLPIHEPRGNMIVDIGGGNTDIAVISLRGIVTSRNIKIAGDRLNADIAHYIRQEFKILIGDKTAEDIKLAVGSVLEQPTTLETVVRGRDLITGLPREVMITDADVREAISQSIEVLLENIKETLEKTPPEIMGDMMSRGITLVGGGALLRGIDVLIESYIGVPVKVALDPIQAVARGTGIVLENLQEFEDTLINSDDELPIDTRGA